MTTTPSKWDLAREQRLRDHPGSKTCKDCGEEKPLADFGRPVPKERAAGRIALAFSPAASPASRRRSRSAEHARLVVARERVL